MPEAPGAGTSGGTDADCLPCRVGLSPGSPAEFGVESLSLQVARQFAEAPVSTGDLSGTYRIAHSLPGPEPSQEAAETPLAFVWWSP